MLDAEDRRELVRVAVMIAAGIFVVVGGSAVLGLSVGIFRALGGF